MHRRGPFPSDEPNRSNRFRARQRQATVASADVRPNTPGWHKFGAAPGSEAAACLLAECFGSNSRELWKEAGMARNLQAAAMTRHDAPPLPATALDIVYGDI